MRELIIRFELENGTPVILDSSPIKMVSCQRAKCTQPSCSILKIWFSHGWHYEIWKSIIIKSWRMNVRMNSVYYYQLYLLMLTSNKEVSISKKQNEVDLWLKANILNSRILSISNDMNNTRKNLALSWTNLKFNFAKMTNWKLAALGKLIGPNHVTNNEYLYWRVDW